MAVIVNFCSVFSVRLGSIIVGVLCLIQAAVLEVACILGLHDIDSVSRNLNDFMYEKDLIFLTSFLNSVKKNPEPYFFGTLIVLAVYSFSCILLIYGALKLNVWLVMPFVGLEFLRLGASLGALVASMLVLKKNSMDLGPLMGGCTGGGFFMLLMIYMWTCPLSLAQELLRRRAGAARAARGNQSIAKERLLEKGNGLISMDEAAAMEAKLWQHTSHITQQYPYLNPTYPPYQGYPMYIE